MKKFFITKVSDICNRITTEDELYEVQKFVNVELFKKGLNLLVSIKETKNSLITELINAGQLESIKKKISML